MRDLCQRHVNAVCPSLSVRGAYRQRTVLPVTCGSLFMLTFFLGFVSLHRLLDYLHLIHCAQAGFMSHFMTARDSTYIYVFQETFHDCQHLTLCVCPAALTPLYLTHTGVEIHPAL